MTTNEMITELTQTVRNLQRDVEVLKEDKDYLYNKLEKAYDDRIALRAENNKLKNSHLPGVAHKDILEEEECIACSA
jgi:FtsZ-binding cell division protein ZapB